MVNPFDPGTRDGPDNTDEFNWYDELDQEMDDFGEDEWYDSIENDTYRRRSFPRDIDLREFYNYDDIDGGSS